MAQVSEKLTSQQVFFIMAGVCIFVIFAGIIKQKMAVLFYIAMRIAIGSIAIVIFNEILQKNGIPVAAGLNPLNFLTLGTLGTGGFGLIYGILFYHLL